MIVDNKEDNKEDKYFYGFYVIWKNDKIIHCCDFIYPTVIADSLYKVDKLLWKKHKKDFKENPFSELNESIGNLKDIELEICETFYSTDDNNYKENILIEMEMFQRNYEIYGPDDEHIFKKTNDPYNMKDLITEINKIIHN